MRRLAIFALFAAHAAFAQQRYTVRVIEYERFAQPSQPGTAESHPDRVLPGGWPLEYGALTQALGPVGVIARAVHRDVVRAGEDKLDETVRYQIAGVESGQVHVLLRALGGAHDFDFNVPLNHTAVISGDPRGGRVEIVAVSVMDARTAARIPELYVVGGAVKAPVAVSRVEPDYPASVRAAHVSGIVIMQVEIDERGTVAGAWVVKDIPDLRQPALDAVTKWKFAPATLNGKPVRSLFNLTVNFKLN